jgi:hypothetical protein
MSDTPRTDALLDDSNDGYPDRWIVSHTRLERELAAAIEQRDKATNDALELAAQVCDEHARGWVVPSQSPFSPLADKIRAMKKECGK